MKPKEKADELIDKYVNASFNCKNCDMPFCDIPCTMLNLSEAKECALIAVNEIIKTDMLIDEECYVMTPSYLQYWQEVKKEIETYGGNK